MDVFKIRFDKVDGSTSLTTVPNDERIATQLAMLCKYKAGITLVL